MVINHEGPQPTHMFLDDKGNKNSLTIHKCINMWTYSFQMKVERREKEITFGSHHHQNHYNSSASVPGPCKCVIKWCVTQLREVSDWFKKKKKQKNGTVANEMLTHMLAFLEILILMYKSFTRFQVTVVYSLNHNLRLR